VKLLDLRRQRTDQHDALHRQDLADLMNADLGPSPSAMQSATAPPWINFALALTAAAMPSRLQ